MYSNAIYHYYESRVTKYESVLKISIFIFFSDTTYETLCRRVCLI